MPCQPASHLLHLGSKLALATCRRCPGESLREGRRLLRSARPGRRGGHAGQPSHFHGLLALLGPPQSPSGVVQSGPVLRQKKLCATPSSKTRTGVGPRRGLCGDHLPQFRSLGIELSEAPISFPAQGNLTCRSWARSPPQCPQALGMQPDRLPRPPCRPPAVWCPHPRSWQLVQHRGAVWPSLGPGDACVTTLGAGRCPQMGWCTPQQHSVFERKNRFVLPVAGPPSLLLIVWQLMMC